MRLSGLKLVVYGNAFTLEATTALYSVRIKTVSKHGARG